MATPPIQDLIEDHAFPLVVLFVSFVSFNLVQFLRLSLSFIAMIFLKHKRSVILYNVLQVKIQIMHFYQE